MSGIIAAVYRVTGWRNFPLVASLVLIAAFMTGFYWREMVREAMCSPQKEQCFREWISATGGWIAIIIGYSTIRHMMRQTDDANRHQKENL